MTEGELQEIWAEALPVLRRRVGLSQAELAEKLQLTRQTIHLYESKKKPIPATTIMLLLIIFYLDPLTCDLLEPLGISTSYYYDNQRIKGKLGIREFFNMFMDDIKEYFEGNE